MKKLLISFVLILGLIITSSAMADTGTSIITAETTAIVNNPNPDDRLNLRTKPSEDAPTLGKYYNGTYVEVLSDEKDGWVKVRIFILEGYMMAKFLVSQDQLPIGAATIPAVTIKNTGGTGLNLRKTQSMNSASLGLYKNGATVRVFGVSETWCHVQAPDGKNGFMLRAQLSPVLEYQKDSKEAAAVRTARVHNPNPDDRLNLRTKPSADAPTLGKYYNGVDVTLLGPEENGWYKVKFGALTGYMQAEFLETDPDKMWMVQSATISFRVNNASGTGLNLRELQSAKSKSLGLYKNGEIGYLLGVGETWCHVGMGNNEVGFMLRESLSPVPEFDKSSGK